MKVFWILLRFNLEEISLFADWTLSNLTKRNVKEWFVWFVCANTLGDECRDECVELNCCDTNFS